MKMGRCITHLWKHATLVYSLTCAPVETQVGLRCQNWPAPVPVAVAVAVSHGPSQGFLSSKYGPPRSPLSSWGNTKQLMLSAGELDKFRSALWFTCLHSEVVTFKTKPSSCHSSAHQRFTSGFLCVLVSTSLPVCAVFHRRGKFET